MSHLRITQAGAVAAATFIIGQLVAFVPSLANQQEALISAGTALIAAFFMVANSVHKLADSNVSARDVEAGALAVAQHATQTELGKVDLNALASQAVAGRLDAAGVEARAADAAKAEVGRILTELASRQAVPPVPPVQAQVQPEVGS